MALEQARLVPPGGGEPPPMLFPQLYPYEIKPAPKTAAPELPQATPAPEPPIDTVKMMEEWQSAYKKAHTGFSSGLTDKEIETSLAGSDLTSGERQALQKIKENFQDLSALDGTANGSVEQSDLTLFRVLLTNTARDIQFYDKGQKFLVENKQRLDNNHDGKLDWYEIYKARTNPDYGNDVQDTIKYLSDRYYGHTLAYTDQSKTTMAFSAFGGQTVPERDFQPGDLGKVINDTQEMAFKYKFVDDYRNVAGGVGLGAGSLLGKYFKLGPWGSIGTSFGTMTAAAVVLVETAKWQGPKQQDEQDARIRKLMASVADFKY